jgi:diphosphomevalonate decarboxylase
MILQDNILENRYRQEAGMLKIITADTGSRLEWECPSNIALIKYWGKKPVQKPVNPSLSFALMDSVTRMELEYQRKREDTGVSVKILLDDIPNPQFNARMLQYLQSVSTFIPFINALHLNISSRNTFPHSAGIASSASSFGALALDLCSMEQELFGTLTREEDFFRKASFLARLGSGSACRSVYGGWVLWGKCPEFNGSGDEAAIPVTQIVHPAFRNYRDAILVVSSGAKAVSSTIGHRLMEDHPFGAARIVQAERNMEQLIQSLIRGDQEAFITLVEQEALTLHGLLMTSNPGIILMLPNTMAILQKVRQFRKESGLPVSFTLDAGANVHLLYPDEFDNKVRDFISDQLKIHCEDGRIIMDQVGSGPVKIG